MRDQICAVVKYCALSSTQYCIACVATSVIIRQTL